MKSQTLICSLLLTVFLTSCGGLSTGQENLFFSTSEFAEPILIRLPNQSSRKFYDSVKANPTVRQQGMNISLRVGGSEVKDFNQKVIAFLRKEDYLTWEVLEQTTISRYGSNTKKHEFFFYQPKLEPLKVSRNEMLGGSSNHMRVAHRELVSIDHRQKTEMHGNEVLNIAFSYRLVSDLPEVNSPETVFKGTAEAYLSREDGQWHLGSINLERGEAQAIIDSMNP